MATTRKRIIERASMLVFFSMLAFLLGLPATVVLNYYTVWFVPALLSTSWSVREPWTATAATAVVDPALFVTVV